MCKSREESTSGSGWMEGCLTVLVGLRLKSLVAWSRVGAGGWMTEAGVAGQVIDVGSRQDNWMMMCVCGSVGQSIWQASKLGACDSFKARTLRRRCRGVGRRVGRSGPSQEAVHTPWSPMTLPAQRAAHTACSMRHGQFGRPAQPIMALTAHGRSCQLTFRGWRVEGGGVERGLLGCAGCCRDWDTQSRHNGGGGVVVLCRSWCCPQAACWPEFRVQSPELV